MFKHLEGDIITLRQKELFARHGSGFVRLYENGSTSVPSVLWDGLETEKVHTSDKFGRLELA